MTLNFVNDQPFMNIIIFTNYNAHKIADKLNICSYVI